MAILQCIIHPLATVVKDIDLLYNIIMVISSESVADSVFEPGIRGINFELKSYHNSWQQLMYWQGPHYRKEFAVYRLFCNQNQEKHRKKYHKIQG